jgi:hypothetical protein
MFFFHFPRKFSVLLLLLLLLLKEKFSPFSLSYVSMLPSCERNAERQRASEQKKTVFSL